MKGAKEISSTRSNCPRSSKLGLLGRVVGIEMGGEKLNLLVVNLVY